MDLQGTVHVPFPTKHETFWSGVSTNSVTIPCRLLRRTGETAGCVLAPYACTLQGELQPANQGCQATQKLLFGQGPAHAELKLQAFVYPSRFNPLHVYHCTSCHASMPSICTASQHWHLVHLHHFKWDKDGKDGRRTAKLSLAPRHGFSETRRR